MSNYTLTVNQNRVLFDARIAIIVARFNDAIVSGLKTGAEQLLASCDITRTSSIEVPGAFEIPLVAQQLAVAGNVDGIVALGAVIRGETAHFDFVAGTCARGLGRVMLDTGLPIGFGVLTCDTQAQAQARAHDNEDNKGREAAIAVVEMVATLRQIKSQQ